MAQGITERLLAWFRESQRALPFRRTRDPYAILVSEVLLQRTRVVSGLPYYERFMARFPTVRDLAAATEEQVLKAWEGLGFYGRARNLHRAAMAIVADHGGRIPGTYSELCELPGIGDYTAGAVASIAFGETVPAIDGNAARVLARVFRLEGDLTRGESKRRLRDIASSLVPPSGPGAFNQSLMELGATVCRPVSPRCPACPIRSECGAFEEGRPEAYPESRPRRAPPTVRVAFGLAERGARVLLVRRPPGGLLAGLWALPGGEVAPRASGADAIREAFDAIGATASIGPALGKVGHTFSHRRWVGQVLRVRVAGDVPRSETAIWAGPADLTRLPVVPFHRRFLERFPPDARGQTRR